MMACRLVNVDIYTFDFKLNHIAKHLKLPAAPRLGPAALDMPQEERLPPVIVVNVQLPAYPVSTSTCCLKALPPVLSVAVWADQVCLPLLLKLVLRLT